MTRHSVNGQPKNGDPTCTTGWRVETNLRSLDRRPLELLLEALEGQTIADLKADILAYAGTTPER